MKRSLVRLLALSIGVLLTAFPQSKTASSTAQGLKTIEGCVKEFLAGKGCDEVMAYTSGGTFLEQAPSAPVVKEAYKNCEVTFLKGLTLNNGTAALSVELLGFDGRLGEGVFEILVAVFGARAKAVFATGVLVIRYSSGIGQWLRKPAKPSWYFDFGIGDGFQVHCMSQDHVDTGRWY